MRKCPNEKAEATKYNEEQLQLPTLRRWEGWLSQRLMKKKEDLIAHAHQLT